MPDDVTVSLKSRMLLVRMKALTEREANHLASRLALVPEIEMVEVLYAEHYERVDHDSLDPQLTLPEHGK